MNWVDIVILVLVLGLGLIGWRSGVIKILFTLVGGVVGLILAGRLYDTAASALPIDNESLAKIAGFVLILFIVMVAAWIAARVLKTVLKFLLLGWVDGLAGAAIGVLLGALAATAVVSVLGIVPSSTVERAVDESEFAEPLVDNMGIVFSLLPSEFDRVKDLVSQGAGLIDTGASILEQSGQLQDLLAEGSNLLEQANNLQDLLDQAQSLTSGQGDLTVGFNGLDSYVGAPVRAIAKSGSGVALGPFEGSVFAGGVAVVAVQGTDADTAYTLHYYVDIDDSGECDGSDQTGSRDVPPGTTELGVAHAPADDAAGVCAEF